jgi:hypothetical protein
LISIHSLDARHVVRHLARRSQNAAEVNWERNAEGLVIEASAMASLWRGLADEMRLALSRGRLRVRRGPGGNVTVTRGTARVTCHPYTDGIYRSTNSIVEVRYV